MNKGSSATNMSDGSCFLDGICDMVYRVHGILSVIDTISREYSMICLTIEILWDMYIYI